MSKVNVNPMKMAKCIKELERIYGIKQGKGGNTTNPNNSDCKTQEQLAKQLDISQDTLTNYKKLNELIPELQSLVENGALNPMKMAKRLEEIEKVKAKERQGERTDIVQSFAPREQGKTRK